MNKAFGIAGFLWLVGCGGAAQEPAKAPTTGAAKADPGGSPSSSSPPLTEAKVDPWALPEGPRDSADAPAAPPKDVSTAAWAKASKVKGIGPAPATCAKWVKPAAKPATGIPTFSGVGFESREEEAARENAKWFAVEVASTSDREKVRVRRAALVPTECADAIVDPSLASSPTAAGAEGQMAIGLSLASKLARTASIAPAIKDASDKEKVKRFIQGPLRQWMVEQASAIEALSAPAGEMTGLARAVVAVESGMADLRLVDRIRSSPTPSTWDKELKAIYEVALDEALEPRKARGRDAALVGLADFASAGILDDPRIDRARTLLSKLYGGRRIDALDALLLPGPAPRTVGEVALLAPPRREPQSARVRFELGRTYWRRVDFVEAAYGASKESTPDNRLVLALSLALAKGPKSAKDMMAAPSPAALGLGSTEALDALAAEPSKVAGFAAFDAAHLRSLSAPDGPAAGPWFADVAARFEKASTLLEEPAQKKIAKERAAAADAIAKAVGKGDR